MPSSPFALIFAGLVLVLAGGCASPWEKHFASNPSVVGQTFPSTSAAEVRSVPFERYQRYVEAERRRRIESTTAPEDLDAAERLAARNRLLEALQVRERGDEVVVLGISEFADTQRLVPTDPRLSAFARRIGADLVVTTSTFVGQVTSIESRPVSSYTQGTTIFVRPRSYRGGGRAFPVTYSEQSTTWIPIPVTEDQFFYAAVFLRRTGEGLD